MSCARTRIGGRSRVALTPEKGCNRSIVWGVLKKAASARPPVTVKRSPPRRPLRGFLNWPNVHKVASVATRALPAAPANLATTETFSIRKASRMPPKTTNAASAASMFPLNFPRNRRISLAKSRVQAIPKAIAPKTDLGQSMKGAGQPARKPLSSRSFFMRDMSSINASFRPPVSIS